MNIHYFDHATTSRPKAPGVVEATLEFYNNICASPSRSDHRLGHAANDVVAKAREVACKYFKARSPSHIVFTSGATEALNLVIRSILKPETEVVASSFDHNSVIRPIVKLREAGVIARTVRARSGLADFVERFVECFNDRTKLAVVTHASNVDGTVVPTKEIVRRANDMKIPVLVDGAQSAGWLCPEMLCCGADFFVAGLHKGLQGPFGLGVLVIGNDDAVLNPLYDGGTGLETLNSLPQSIIPGGLETGTSNIAAIAAAIPAFELAISPKAEESVRKIMQHFDEVLKKILMLDNILSFNPLSTDFRVPIFSLKHKHMNVHSFARALEVKYQIFARAGLHCAPLRHLDLGTLPDGAVRISFGHNTTEEDTMALVHSLENLNKEK
ncbi:aminotransferase class V-fold PLP-dependent enzyme [candidate division KSB1 bacterium]|nr:aminotransferase class V-fold PLP-dependent enzyme [candidate division KSB1 bacterium]